MPPSIQTAESKRPHPSILWVTRRLCGRCRYPYHRIRPVHSRRRGSIRRRILHAPGQCKTHPPRKGETLPRRRRPQQGKRIACADVPQPGREIFFRYYYYCQPVAQIAQEMALNPASVRTRLHRGRQKLKETLTKGGYPIPVERNAKTAVSADRSAEKKCAACPPASPLRAGSPASDSSPL